MERIYYPDYEKRYPYLSAEARIHYPDAIKLEGRPLIRREFTLVELEIYGIPLVDDAGEFLYDEQGNIKRQKGENPDTLLLYASDIRLCDALSALEDWPRPK